MRARLAFAFLLIATFIGAPFVLAVFAPSPARYAHHGDVLLPDPKVTPGIIRTIHADSLCAPDFRTGKYRLTTAKEKNEAYAEYGVERNKGICKGGCEVDHLVPLELGGMDELGNLWPQPSQPKPGFHEKDKLEDYLRHHICIEKDIQVTDAQKMLQKDWYAAYLKFFPAK